MSSTHEETILLQQKKFFLTGHTRDLRWRKRQLNALDSAIHRWADRIITALAEDMQRPPVETFTSEIATVRSEISYTRRNLHRWGCPQRTHSPLLAQPCTTRVIREPYGVSLIIGPSNYPFGLLIYPLVSAIAAGNCVILKPSDATPSTARLIKTMIAESFDPSYITVVQGGKEAVEALIRRPLDFVFFTGSTFAGKQVMTLAAHSCIGVVAELGGQNPCLVDETADIEAAARRIARAKFLNAGQTCVAPNFLLVHHSVKKRCVDALAAVIRKFYSDDPRHSPDYSRIVTPSNWEYLAGIIQSGNTLFGGTVDRSERYIAPTLLEASGFEDTVLQSETFGPILPIVEYTSIEGVIHFLQGKETPLALYLFSRKKKLLARMIRDIQSGSVCLNDVMNQVSSPSVPFGGQGESGTGQYHGKEGFLSFSRPRTVLKRAAALEFFPRVYPPYKNSLTIVKRLWRFFIN
jgi:aldehyde dehydrogenase (NAD+)